MHSLIVLLIALLIVAAIVWAWRSWHRRDDVIPPTYGNGTGRSVPPREKV